MAPGTGRGLSVRPGSGDGLSVAEVGLFAVLLGLLLWFVYPWRRATDGGQKPGASPTLGDDADR